ncbi:MAG: hypothetical protein DBX59_04605 [Bacillota bacterium]|nr:MAG: hypothetical protein DBX59_04605 [Bacillota bacterium]
MGFIAAKCPNCGAAIDVDDSKEAGVCRFCNTAFVTEKVIQNYNYNIDNRTTVTNNIETAVVQNGDSFETLYGKYTAMLKIDNLAMAERIAVEMYKRFPDRGMTYIIHADLMLQSAGRKIKYKSIDPAVFEQREKSLDDSIKNGSDKPDNSIIYSYTITDYKNCSKGDFCDDAKLFMVYVREKAAPLLTDEERADYADLIKKCEHYVERLLAFSEKIKAYNEPIYIDIEMAEFNEKRKAKRKRIIGIIFGIIFVAAFIVIAYIAETSGA